MSLLLRLYKQNRKRGSLGPFKMLYRLWRGPKGKVNLRVSGRRWPWSMYQRCKNMSSLNTELKIFKFLYTRHLMMKLLWKFKVCLMRLWERYNHGLLTFLMIRIGLHILVLRRELLVLLGWKDKFLPLRNRTYNRKLTLTCLIRKRSSNKFKQILKVQALIKVLKKWEKISLSFHHSDLTYKEV